MKTLSLLLLAFTAVIQAADTFDRYLTCDSGKKAFQSSVFAHLNTHCVKCHQQGPGPKFLFKNVDETYEVILEKTQFEDPDRSKFHKKGGDGHCKDYGHDCKTDEKVITDLITKWWIDGQKSCEKKTWRTIGALPLGALPRTMSYSLGENGTTLSVDVTLKPAGEEIPHPLYVLRNLKIRAGAKTVKIAGVQFSVNGKSFGFPDAFESVHAVISPKTGQLLASNQVVLPKFKSGEDSLSFSVEIYEEKENYKFECRHPDLFAKNVFPLMDYRCTFCHGVKTGSGRADAKAQTVFPVPMGKVTDAEIVDLCRRSLERTQTQNLLESSLFRLALGGDANHERVYSLLDTSIPNRVKKVYPDWAEWAEAERENSKEPK